MNLFAIGYLYFIFFLRCSNIRNAVVNCIVVTDNNFVHKINSVPIRNGGCKYVSKSFKIAG